MTRQNGLEVFLSWLIYTVVARAAELNKSKVVADLLPKVREKAILAEEHVLRFTEWEYSPREYASLFICVADVAGFFCLLRLLVLFDDILRLLVYLSLIFLHVSKFNPLSLFNLEQAIGTLIRFMQLLFLFLKYGRVFSQFFMHSEVYFLSLLIVQQNTLLIILFLFLLPLNLFLAPF